MSRGRRLEFGGYGALLGAGAAAQSRVAGYLVALAFVLVGIALQVRAERRRKPGEITVQRDGEVLTGKAREEEIQRAAVVLAWEAAGRPGLPRGRGGEHAVPADEVRGILNEGPK